MTHYTLHEVYRGYVGPHAALLDAVSSARLADVPLDIMRKRIACALRNARNVDRALARMGMARVTWIGYPTGDAFMRNKYGI